MIVFSLTEYFSMILMLVRNTFLSDFEGLWIDLIITLPLSTLIPLTDAYPKFNYYKPFYVLTSFPVVISIFSQFIINISFQLGGFLIMNHLFLFLLKLYLLNKSNTHNLNFEIYYLYQYHFYKMH